MRDRNASWNRSNSPADRENTTAAPARRGEPSAAITPESASAHAPSDPASTGMAASLRAPGNGAPQTDAPSSESQRPLAETVRAASAEPFAQTQPRNSGPVQNIQLHMNTADGHVEVRVSGRGGDVRVDVHTPDSRLAGDLRENLPELTARIEQTGYRAEISQPTSQASPDRWRFAQTAGSPPDSDGRRQGGQNQQEGRRDDSRDDPPPAKDTSDRKDFRWLYNSIP